MVLNERPEFEVTNLAFAGAMSDSALTQADKIPEATDLVILEIGGNDLFSGRSSREFAAHLDALIREVRKRCDNVLICELPLPPTCALYGTVQHRIARRCGASMLHRRTFAAIVTNPTMRVDGVHLSQTGHDRFAAMIGDALQLQRSP